MAEANLTNPHRYEFDPASGVVFCKLDHRGLVGYRVGDDGSVWCCLGRGGRRGAIESTWRRLTARPDKDGYLVVQARGRQRVHRLVLVAFVGPCPSNQEACHDPDRDPANNSLGNLRWDTPKANHADRRRHGRTCPGERNVHAKLTEQAVIEIRRRFAVAKGGRKHAPPGIVTQLAQEFGASYWSIESIIGGHSWKHLI